MAFPAFCSGTPGPRFKVSPLSATSPRSCAASYSSASRRLAAPPRSTARQPGRGGCGGSCRRRHSWPSPAGRRVGRRRRRGGRGSARPSRCEPASVSSALIAPSSGATPVVASVGKCRSVRAAGAGISPGKLYHPAGALDIGLAPRRGPALHPRHRRFVPGSFRKPRRRRSPWQEMQATTRPRHLPGSTRPDAAPQARGPRLPSHLEMVVVASAVRVLSAASSRGLGPAHLDPGEGLRLAPDGRRGQRRLWRGLVRGRVTENRSGRERFACHRRRPRALSQGHPRGPQQTSLAQVASVRKAPAAPGGARLLIESANQ